LSFQGRTHSPETRLRMSLRARGNTRASGYTHTLDTIEKIRSSSIGRIHTSETKQHLREVFLGIRTDSECVVRNLGELNPHWCGGTSVELYPTGFRTTIRYLVLSRDFFTCQECDSQIDLSPHHIDYNKSNIDPRNLITLCRSCNSKANGNRAYYIERYRAKICAIYGEDI
jgi:hypothetical protein